MVAQVIMVFLPVVFVRALLPGSTQTDVKFGCSMHSPKGQPRSVYPPIKSSAFYGFSEV
jgi:hypothetical protein